MSKQKGQQSQTPSNGQAAFASAPSEDANQVKTVVGRRLRPEKEVFVLDDSEHEADSNPLETEVLRQCYFCLAESSVDEWDDNADACPGCDRSRTAMLADDAPPTKMSEAEMTLAAIRAGKETTDDEYKIRVDHLPNFLADGRSDTRADRKFCCYLQPFTFDYLDVLQRKCLHLKVGEEGTFLFEAFKLSGPGRGFADRWTDTLMKIDASDAGARREATTTQLPAASTPDGLGEIEKSLDVIERVWGMMSRRRPGSANNNEGGGATALTTADPVDEMGKTIDMFDKMTTTMERLRGPLVPAGGEQSLGVAALNILGGILKDPNVTPLLAASAQWVAAKAAGIVGGPPKEVLELIDVLVDQMTKNNHPAHSATHTLQFLKQHPQLQAIVGRFANQSATELLITISQLKPEYAHVRKLQHGPAWLEAFKQFLMNPQSPPAPNSNNHAGPPAPPPTTPPAPPAGVSTESGSDRIGQPAAAQQPPPPPVPKGEDEKAFNRLLRGIAADMSRSHCVDAAQVISDPDNVESERADEAEAVAEALDYLEKFPEHRATASMIASMPPEFIVAQVAQAVDDETLIENQGSILYAHHFKNALVAALNEEAEGQRSVVSEEQTPEA